MKRRLIRNVATLEKFQSLVDAGMTHAEIAEMYDVSTKGLSAYLSRNNIHSRKPNPHKGKTLNVRPLRIERKQSQHDVAGSIGISQNAVSLHERHVKFPCEKTLKAYAEHFGVEVDELFVNTKG